MYTHEHMGKHSQITLWIMYSTLSLQFSHKVMTFEIKS